MYPIRLAAFAAVFLVGSSGRAALRPVGTRRIAAEVRFANHLTGTRSWTLASNGTVLFTAIAPGTTTAYIANTDTLSVLTLRRDGSDSAVASTNFPFVGGSFYTVTATNGNGVRPLLAVERDVPPKDTMP